MKKILSYGFICIVFISLVLSVSTNIKYNVKKISRIDNYSSDLVKLPEDKSMHKDIATKINNKDYSIQK